MNSILLSIIIPIYNEEKTIIPLLKKVNHQKISKEIIVVNDGSSDRTSELLKMNSDYYDKYISLENNYGKGYAIKKGIEVAQGALTLIQDGDLEYNPNDYEKLINKIRGDCKIVYGSRTLKGGNFTTPGGLRPIFSKLANFLLTTLSNTLNGQKLTDAHTCYKLFSTEILKKIDLKEKGFAFCPEVTAKLSKLGLKIEEVPIDYFGRSYGEGKKIRVRHAFEAIFTLFIYNYPYKRFKSWLRG